MMPPSFSDTPDSIEAREFEQHIQEGIIAVKNGNLALAKKLLDQAALVNDTDPRIWIWMSATTEDLTERRGYLERAVALDPSNATAKRGLLLITEKLEKERLMPEGGAYTPPPEPAVEEAVLKTYTCPNCGAAIAFDIHDTSLVCGFCGYTSKVDQRVLDGSTDQVLDAALPTERAHRWAESQTRLTCEQCGSTLILPPGQTADTCPYCAANRFVTSQALVELVDPSLIALFKVDPQNAGVNTKKWLSKGFLSPDDLSIKQSGLQLLPAYYPFWIFEGTLELPWFYEMNEGSSRMPRSEMRNGSKFEMFKGVLIPGLRKISLADLAGIQPFNLSDLVEFSPDFLPGWIAITYDHPLADASLQARELIINKIKPGLSGEVDPGHTKRNFGTGAGKWSGLTYNLALLPLYIGNYQFQGKRYRLFVNGQTGQVSGKKPTDTVKLVMLLASGLVLLVILVTVLYLLSR